MNIAVAAAVNDDEMLIRCLASSPELARGEYEVTAHRGYTTAGSALNAAIDATSADVLVIAHQDVYLHDGFLAKLKESIEELEKFDSLWAVLGQVGVTADRVVVGETWSSGRGKMLGKPIQGHQPVVAIDEMLIIVNRRAGLRFDEYIPSFHLYGVDIVQSALMAGRKSYVLPMSALHFSKPITRLSGGYSQAYKFMQRKYRSSLPIPTLIADLHWHPLRLWLQNFRYFRLNRGRRVRTEPVGSPAEISRSLGYE